jgi:hypothetical protein
MVQNRFLNSETALVRRWLVREKVTVRLVFPCFAQKILHPI